MYVSVKETAKKFSISKRRVQTLCEQGRIKGTSRISGVWLIPSDAKKPADARRKTNESKRKTIYYSDISEIQNESLTPFQVANLLSISTSTVKNWVKTGKLIQNSDGETFDKEYIKKFVLEIKKGNKNYLKSRRNKKSISGKAVYKDYIKNENNRKIIERILDFCEQITEEELKIILANFAIQLYKQSGGKVISEKAFLEGKFKIANNDVFNELIKDLLEGVEISKVNLENIQYALESKIQLVSTEDTLGFVYISLRDLGLRKQTGAYYTPEKVVTSLIDNLEKTVNIDNKLICDPCCGTGNFLIGLVNKGVNISNLYGQDSDKISIIISRINMFLLDNSVTKEQLYSHFICENTLLNTFNQKFSIVLGNPPWGYAFEKDEILKLTNRYLTAKNTNVESFDLFIEKGLEMLEEDGYLAYVLPEAVLSVTSHQQARELLVKHSSFKFICFLGNVFTGVQCPSIVLGVQKGNEGQIKHCRVINNDEEFVIEKNRDIDSSVFSFNMNDQEYECLRKITSVQDAKYLEGNAKFALGIVTGNNKKCIKKAKDNKSEVILKGSNIYRYAIKEDDNYIDYIPESFQQVAPTEVYRAEEKLLYRFIADVPVFAYDNKQRLSLNSCNILIPQIEGMNIKYVLAVLNSSVSTYFINKKYNSIKLLRSHIESLPIPMINEEKQREVVEKVDNLISLQGNIEETYRELEEKIMDIYDLSKNQREIINNAVSTKRQFLIK